MKSENNEKDKIKRQQDLIQVILNREVNFDDTAESKKAYDEAVQWLDDFMDFTNKIKKE